ncbi:MAG: apolipoprotein A1/A4/E family protein [Sulfolobales archaeon]|nr:apolipoprotein A1/A4/E family protein [Sulfolobales archaeon]
MSEEVKKWFDDFINNIVQKIRAGKELNALETQVITNYASNRVLYEYLERRLGELERNLRDEIRKTREELLANDEKVKQELLAHVDKVKQELLANDEKIKQELMNHVEKVKQELLANDERIKQELLANDEKIRQELLAHVEKVKQELKDEIQRVKTDLETKIKEVDRKVEATRSDLGLVAEEVYVKNFVDYLQSNGEKVISVYRHYETSLGEIDAVIETSAKVYAVEIKLRAEVSDVDDLLNKTKALKEELGREVYPVLTGSRINKTVRGYAKGLGILVI